MTRRNLADAAFEPSDEDLTDLSREAFAGVREANERALAAMRQRIAARSATVLAALDPERSEPEVERGAP